MLVVLKIPVVYLCAVVWWAIRAEPQPLEGAGSGCVARARGPSATGGHVAPACSAAARCRAAAARRSAATGRLRPRAG